jgi:hypothetical protein
MFTAARPVPPSAAADPRTAVQLFPEASGRGSGNQSPITCSAVNPRFSSRGCTACAGSPCWLRSADASSAATISCSAIRSSTSRRRLGLSRSTSVTSVRASRTVERHPARGSTEGEASSLRRCRRIRRICDLSSRRSDFPKLSISSARFSQSSGRFEFLARRSAAACSLVQRKKSCS